MVFVDDLDRCGHNGIRKTLEAVRLVMDLPNVIVIIAVDERIALQAVGNHYKHVAADHRSPADIARDYLGKIVQLPIRLQESDWAEEGQPPGPLERYVREGLFPDARPTTEAIGEIDMRPVTAPGVEEGVETPVDIVEAPKPVVSAEDATAPAAPLPEERPPDTAAIKDGENTPDDSKLPATEDRRQMLRERMVETDTEVIDFQWCAAQMNLRNPRQLRRLRNSYRLLKLSESGTPEKDLMWMLFWQEFLHDLPHEAHEACEAFIWGDEEKPKLPPKRLSAADRLNIDTVAESARERVRAQFNDDWERYASLSHSVLRVVLPRGSGPPKADEELPPPPPQSSATSPG